MYILNIKIYVVSRWPDRNASLLSASDVTEKNTVHCSGVAYTVKITRLAML